jgi:hypothetical protein
LPPSVPPPAIAPGAPRETPTEAAPPLTDLALGERSAALGGETVSVPMIGDLGGFCARRLVTVAVSQTVTTSSTQTLVFRNPNGAPGPTQTTTTVSQVTVPGLQRVTICDPIPSVAGSGFKLADNESPIPTSRVFVTFNDFQSLTGTTGIAGPSSSSTTTTTVLPTQGGAISNTLQTVTTTTFPTVVIPARAVDVRRELFGFEQAFFDNRASIELRVPIFQTHATGGETEVGGDDFGDMTVVLKTAPFLDRNTGNVLAAGLAVTAPTGPGIPTVDGNIRSTLLQPYFGYLWNLGRGFLEGYTSVIVPTDSRDVTVLFNDVGIGYSLAQRGDAFLTFIAPVVEAHVTTPLDHRNADAVINVPDLVDLTAGVHLGFCRRSVLSVGVATPVTGPRPFDVEAIAQLNYYW